MSLWQRGLINKPTSDTPISDFVIGAKLPPILDASPYKYNLLIIRRDTCGVNTVGIAKTNDTTVNLFIQNFLIYNPSFIVIGMDTRYYASGSLLRAHVGCWRGPCFQYGSPKEETKIHIGLQLHIFGALTLSQSTKKTSLLEVSVCTP